MEIKGLAIKSSIQFIELNFPDIYHKWLLEINEQARNQYIQGLMVSKWYDIDIYLRQPLLKAADMLGYTPQDLGWELGVFSSQMALRGIYRFFLRFGGPAAMCKRVPFFLSAYYRPAEAHNLYVDSRKKESKTKFVNFVDKNDLVIYRVMGWAYNTLLEAGATDAEVKLTDFESDKTYSLYLSWK